MLLHLIPREYLQVTVILLLETLPFPETPEFDILQVDPA